MRCTSSTIKIKTAIGLFLRVIFIVSLPVLLCVYFPNQFLYPLVRSSIERSSWYGPAAYPWVRKTKSLDWLLLFVDDANALKGRQNMPDTVRSEEMFRRKSCMVFR